MNFEHVQFYGHFSPFLCTGFVKPWSVVCIFLVESDFKFIVLDFVENVQELWVCLVVLASPQ